jgi:hypothetical protein
VEGKMDKTYGDVTLGIDTLGVKGRTFRVSYTKQFSQHSEFHSVDLKFSIPF